MFARRLDRPPVALSVALLPALFMLTLGAAPAGAIPEDFYPSTSSAEAVVPVVAAAAGPLGGRPCFLFRANWNDALDGPQPVC